MKIKATGSSLVVFAARQLPWLKTLRKLEDLPLKSSSEKNIKPIFMTSSKMISGPCEKPFLSFEWSDTKVYEKDRQTYLEGEKRMMRGIWFWKNEER